MSKLARIFSIVMHPLLMPTYAVLVLLNAKLYIGFNVAPSVKLIIYCIVFTNTFLLPVFISLLLLKQKKINSMEMETTQERRLPYFVAAICFVLTYYLLLKFNLSVLLYIVMLGASMALLLTLLINFKWKISAHMVGIGGLAGALIGIALRLYVDLLPVVLIVLLLAGLLGSSRLFLKAHTPAQIYAGFLLGVGSQLALILGL